MISKILAIVAAAVCAGAIVGLIPEPTPAVAAGSSSSVQSRGTAIPDSNKSAVVAAVRIAESRNAACSHGWPYYAPVCLHDNRRPDGKARIVRLVTADRSVAARTLQAPR